MDLQDKDWILSQFDTYIAEMNEHISRMQQTINMTLRCKEKLNQGEDINDVMALWQGYLISYMKSNSEKEQGI